jgi:hypothetical protein
MARSCIHPKLSENPFPPTLTPTFMHRVRSSRTICGDRLRMFDLTARWSECRQDTGLTISRWMISIVSGTAPFVSGKRPYVSPSNVVKQLALMSPFFDECHHAAAFTRQRECGSHLDALVVDTSVSQSYPETLIDDPRLSHGKRRLDLEPRCGLSPPIQLNGFRT